MTRAAIYARVSTDRQETENQLAELRDFCARRVWEIHREYVDGDVSGKADQKPELERLLREAHEGRFGVVVFWALDRITRKGVLDALQILHGLGALGVDFISFREPHLNSQGPWRDMIIAIIATVASFELERTRERIKAGMKRAKAEGKHVGRPRRTYPVESTEIARMRLQGSSWGALARRYQLPRTTVRRLYQKGLPEIQGQGTGPEVES